MTYLQNDINKIISEVEKHKEKRLSTVRVANEILGNKKFYKALFQLSEEYLYKSIKCLEENKELFIEYLQKFGINQNIPIYDLDYSNEKIKNSIDIHLYRLLEDFSRAFDDYKDKYELLIDKILENVSIIISNSIITKEKISNEKIIASLDTLLYSFINGMCFR